MQLLTNNNWEITKIEQLDIIGDDGTGLIVSDSENDIVVGRSNTDNIMWEYSVVDNPEEPEYNPLSIIGRGYNFRLKLHPGKWKEGKSGTIRITFRNVMRAGSQESYIDYPFYTTIDLKMTSEKTSYTDSGEPLFYLYPLRFDKRLYYDENRASEGLKKDITEADNICKAVGDGWRLPNANELILSYVYRDALGGDANQGSGYAGQNIFGWFADRNWSSSVDPIDSNTRFTMDFSSGVTTTNSIWDWDKQYFRCVRNGASSGGYPKVSGATIISRDNSGGVKSSILLASGESPAQYNKVAPKFEVDLVDKVNTGMGAKAECEGRSGNWRLPTQRELLLIYGLGGMQTSYNGDGFTVPTWSGGFVKVDNWLWSQTVSVSGKFYVVGPSPNAWENGQLQTQSWDYTDSGLSWVHYRCVRTID